MTDKIKVVISGINGRMGRASAGAILKDPELQLAGAFGCPGKAYVGRDVGQLVSRSDTGILISNGFQEVLSGDRPDVLLDFTRADFAFDLAKQAIENGIRPVIGTSGLKDREIDILKDSSLKHSVGGMIVPNFSVGAVLMMEFARQAGAHFSNVEIVEMHDPKKHDAPSGTAMYTIKKLASIKSSYNPSQVEEHELLPGARGAQAPSGVRVHSIRLPGLISQQEVLFGSDGEMLRIRHDSFKTECFNQGIIMALKSVMKMNALSIGLESLLLQNTP